MDGNASTRLLTPSIGWNRVSGEAADSGLERETLLAASNGSAQKAQRSHAPRLADAIASPQIMERLLRRECARADRGGDELSLLLFRVHEGRGRRGKSAARLARTMLKRARLTDEIGWFTDDYLAALLPGTGADGARAFAEGVNQMIHRRERRPLAIIYTYPRGGAKPANRNAPPRANENTHHAAEIPVASLHDLLVVPMPRWKRAIDVVGTLLLLIAFGPLMLAAALGIRLTSRGPAIFRQLRSGIGGRPFQIYKFRTMVVNAEKRQQELRQFSEQDGPAFKLAGDPRITRIGAILRKTSIDELPQLWNVLKGDMSLVGPRPLPVDEQEACEPWQRHRLQVTPGLTCIWQVKGRSTVTFAEWVRMDVEYIRRRTIFHDLSLLIRTVPAVLLRKGAR